MSLCWLRSKWIEKFHSTPTFSLLQNRGMCMYFMTLLLSLSVYVFLECSVWQKEHVGIQRHHAAEYLKLIAKWFLAICLTVWTHGEKLTESTDSQGCRKQSPDGQAQLDVGGEVVNNSRAKHAAKIWTLVFLAVRSRFHYTSASNWDSKVWKFVGVIMNVSRMRAYKA